MGLFVSNCRLYFSTFVLVLSGGGRGNEKLLQLHGQRMYLHSNLKLSLFVGKVIPTDQPRQ